MLTIHCPLCKYLLSEYFHIFWFRFSKTHPHQYTVADENWTDDAPKEFKEMFSPKGCENFKNKSDYAEVKHGEWMKHKPNPEVMRAYHALGMHKGMSENSIYWTCSECEKWGVPYNKYCPNCGADMRGKINGKE